MKRPSFIKNFKIIVIGDTNTGKTSMIHRFTNNVFPKFHFTTPLPIEHIINNNLECQLNIWDTTGMNEWQSANTSVYHDVQSIILTCSYDERESLTDLRDFWIPTLNEYMNTKAIPIFLAINKSDLSDCEKAIESDEIEQIESEIKPYKSFIVSAHDNKNVKELFETVAVKLTYDHLIDPRKDNSIGICNEPRQDKSKRCLYPRF